jgi:hypothetical protein
MVETIRAQHSQVSSEKSVHEFFDLFVNEVESFTEPLVSEGDADDLTTDDVEELYVGEGANGDE